MCSAKVFQEFIGNEHYAIYVKERKVEKLAAKCDVCGKMKKKYYTTYAGDIVCNKTCMNAYRLESYLLRMEERREKDEVNNKKAFQQARDMAGWLSLYKYGNDKYKKLAAKAINAWAR